MSYAPNYAPLPETTRLQVRRWMRREMALVPEFYPNSTLLAEACGDALALADTTIHAVIPEDVYEIAGEFFC